MSVGRSIAIVSHTITAEPIEMPFGAWSWVSPRNQMGVQISPCKGAMLMGKHYLHGKWLAERARSTILLQQNPSFGKMLGPVPFSCRRQC